MSEKLIILWYGDSQELQVFLPSYIHIVLTYRVSQEECARLQEGVPYVKVY